jgi:hypothetical protein
MSPWLAFHILAGVIGTASAALMAERSPLKDFLCVLISVSSGESRAGF